MALIQITDCNSSKEIQSTRAVSIQDNTNFLNPDDSFSKEFPKTISFNSSNMEYVAIHLTPQDIKKLREWALQQSINEL